MIRENLKSKSIYEPVGAKGFEKCAVHKIISDLNFHKVCASLVPKMLTNDHKTKRITALLENVCQYQDEGELFVKSIITGNVAWVYEFTPESKRNSMNWKHPHSPTTKKNHN
jgi:hypothetical protein